jgi:membrane associated rhomboid family serine protease
MIIAPYSAALNLSRPPVVTIIMVVLCTIIFFLQVTTNITESLLYYPETWNPVTMVTSSLAHADIPHLFWNILFYLAFAPTLEILIGSKFRYIWIMLFISFVVGVCDSISVLIGVTEPLPSLGFSGIVMGMFGLSAYLMPKVRIKVFWWYIFAWKTFYVRAWVLAVYFVGGQIWIMFTADDYGNIGVVAHVAGGLAGYFYGYFWLKDRREEIKDELAHEVKAMRIKQQHGKIRSEAFRYNKAMDQNLAEKQETQDQDRFMRQLYKMVTTHQDSEAVNLILSKHDLYTPTYELEKLFERMEEWGPSRALLCLGRLIIHKLDKEKRDGKALVYIARCQKFSPKFLLTDLSRVLYYAEMALETGRLDITKNLVSDAQKRYGELINFEHCNHLLQKTNPNH